MRTRTGRSMFRGKTRVHQFHSLRAKGGERGFSRTSGALDDLTLPSGLRERAATATLTESRCSRSRGVGNRTNTGGRGGSAMKAKIDSAPKARGFSYSYIGYIILGKNAWETRQVSRTSPLYRLSLSFSLSCDITSRRASRPRHLCRASVSFGRDIARLA